MLRIDCPFCGVRNHNEFTYLEDGSVAMPALTDTDSHAWYEAVFLRDNPRGLHVEDWHHTQGCRMVLRVTRDTLTHQITRIEPAHPDYKDMLTAKKRAGAVKTQARKKEAPAKKSNKMRAS